MQRMGHIFEADKSDDKRRILPGPLPSANCKQCFTKSYTHLCPECHFELLHDVGQVKQRIIAVIGGTGTGKSHLIGSFIFAMRHEVGTNINFTTRLLGDDTQKRWEEDFYKPVFVRRTVLPGTTPADRDSRVKAPLVLRLTSKDKLLKKVVNTSIFDSAGEDIASFQTLSVHIRSILYADGIIFLIDPLQIESVRQQLPGITLPSPDPRSHPDYILDRLLRLFEEQGGVSARGKISVPTAIVLSKIDTLIPILDPGSMLLKASEHYRKLNLTEIHSVNTEVNHYLRKWLTQSFCDIIEQKFTSYHYFGVSALGKQHDTTGQLEVIEPLRVEEPFLWLLYKKGFVKGK
jgi:GTPase SAR1 family protein